MAYISLALTIALAVAAVAEPLRFRRQSSDLIASQGALAASGSGWSADNHAESVIATGIPGASGGWGQEGWGQGVPASILISSQGQSDVGQSGEILEITSNDGQGNLLGAQTIDVNQQAVGENALAVEAAGGDVVLASSSDAIAQGQGDSAAAGTLDVISTPGAGWSGSSLGMAKP